VAADRLIERRLKVAGIPLLTLAHGTSPRPAVLFYHGLQSDKETHRKELESLAAQGFLAVGVDAVGHGERRIPNLSAFLNRDELMTQVVKLLRPNIEEVPLLVDHLIAEGYRRVGLAGISFGAMVAFGAVLREPRLSAVVAILGDPRWCRPNPSAYPATPLFAWNGGRDQHIDPAGAREFMRELQRLHPRDSFKYHEYPQSDHFMEPNDWSDGWTQTLAWFNEHLP
jgi:dienelactone hydrolase